MTLKTTTWKDRNVDNLERTLQVAQEKGMKAPSLVNIGPGGSVHFLAASLPVGPTASLSRKEKFIRVFESFIRKTGLFRLSTVEPTEVLRVFSPLEPSSIAVFDREPKVLRAVDRLKKEGAITVPLETGICDLQKSPTGASADIVVALNIIARTSDRSKTLNNILDSVKPGGLICVNIEEAPEGFAKKGKCVFERVVRGG